MIVEYTLVLEQVRLVLTLKISTSLCYQVNYIAQYICTTYCCIVPIPPTTMLFPDSTTIVMDLTSMIETTVVLSTSIASSTPTTAVCRWMYSCVLPMYVILIQLLLAPQIPVQMIAVDN